MINAATEPAQAVKADRPHSPTMLNPSRGGGGKPWASLMEREVARLPKGTSTMRPFLSRGALAVAASLLLWSVAGAQEIKTFQRRNPVVEAVSKTKASIVTVRTPRPGGGKDAIGSGVLVDERGILITNKHVVGHAKNVTVRLYDGTD